MRTIVYIDGYNLYYGRLTKTWFKWLDVVALMKSIVETQDPSSQIIRTTFFSAPALAKFARRGNQSVQAQGSYHRALQKLYSTDQFDLVLGSHVCSPELLPKYVDGQPPSKEDRVHVWRITEKKTDVNIALRMYRDVRAGLCDQVVLCSNDSDGEPVLRAIREDFPAVRIGVIAPVRPREQAAEGEHARRLSVDLANQAHWTRKHVLDEELEKHQLPLLVPTNKKPIRKPEHWKRPDKGPEG